MTYDNSEYFTQANTIVIIVIIATFFVFSGEGGGSRYTEPVRCS